MIHLASDNLLQLEIKKWKDLHEQDIVKIESIKQEYDFMAKQVFSVIQVIQWLFNDYYLLIYSFRRYDIDIMKGFTQNLIKLHILYFVYYLK